MDRKPEEIDRLSLGTAYIENMVQYLVSTTDAGETEARAFVEDYVRKNAKLPRMKVVMSHRPGMETIEEISFAEFISIIKDKVLTPNGCVFRATTHIVSVVSDLIALYKKRRKGIKGEMFTAKAAGDNQLARLKKGSQNSVKVTLNSLPGSYGFKSSIFNNKGCYNAVTSCGRSLISNSFVCCEQILGNNITLFNVHEATNLLVLIKGEVKDDEAIRTMMREQKLPYMTREDVVAYFSESVKMYSLNCDLSQDKHFIKVLDSMSDEQVQFAWYHSNMQHIAMGEHGSWKPAIKEMFDVSTIDTTNTVLPENGFKDIPGGMLATATTVMAAEIAGIQTADIINEKPDVAKRVYELALRIVKFHDDRAEVFKLFVNHNLAFQNVMSRNEMQRKSVVVSDTDSVIYTALQWSEWYTGNPDNLTADSYSVATLATHWLVEANSDVMAKFAIATGALGDRVGIIQMKSEFTYAAMLLYDIKKVYAALTLAQEGILFKQVEPDLKGAAIRGVKASPRAKEFTINLLVEDILKPVVAQEISAIELIDKVAGFEKVIKGSLQSGNTDFLPITSVKTAAMYAKPDSSAWFMAKAWNEIFGDKYEHILPPIKLPLMKIMEPSDAYFTWLEKKDKDIHDRFKRFIATNKKSPSAFFIPARLDKVPKELMPLIDIRQIVYYNISPAYLTLDSINIGVGFSDKHVLLSDIYTGERAA